MSDAPIIPPGQTLPPLLTETERSGADGNGRGSTRHRRKRHRDRFGVLNAFVDFTLRHLSRAEAGVWLVLWRDTRNGTARTAQADIARRIGADPRTVRRALVRLEVTGLVRIVWRGGFRKGASVYALAPLIREGCGQRRPTGRGHFGAVAEDTGVLSPRRDHKCVPHT
jgi:hypothetical protein